jgi:hypothetical protein
MPSNYLVNNIDLDSLFEPIGDTAKRADVGYLSAGTDISNFYANASEGTPYGTTDYQSNNTDIGQLFAAAGSVGATLFLYTWGLGSLGRLGYVEYLGPAYSWTAVSAGGVHTAAIRNDGLLFAWGAGTNGQLGTGDTANRSSPVQIGSSSWTVVSAGDQYTAAIRGDGG